MRQVYILQHPEILKYEADLESQIERSLSKINYAQLGRTTTTDQTGNKTFWYDIPVVVHVIHDYNSSSSSADYVSDDSIYNYVKSWNIVYA